MNIDAKAKEIIAGCGLASEIAAALLAVRNETLEEAAKVVDGTVADHDEDTPGGWCAANAARHAATAIRRMKDTTR
jgi:hypothetical protein